MIFNGLKITTYTLGVINNLLFLHILLLETYHPQLRNSILGKSSFDLVASISFLSVVTAIVFGIALSYTKNVDSEKKQWYYFFLFLLNIFSFGFVFFIMMFMLDPYDGPWFG